MIDFGVIGLGTMGANIARNAARNGARVVLYNRTTEKTDTFMEAYGHEGTFEAARTYDEFLSAFSGKKVILLMVKAGKPVDAVLEELVPQLNEGDIIIDGGNSHFSDTERREQELQTRGVHYVGMGISGGEEGALNGPSMMPGGSREGYDYVAPLLQSMAADDGRGGKCVTYIGPGGAGHFVKTVHNGIEYGLMQLLAESYDFLKHLGGYSNEELAETYDAWNNGEDLQSFLTEITGKIFRQADDKGSGDLIDNILDAAKQKGTGKWTTEAALDLGVAIPTITAGVDARILSGSRDLREQHADDVLREDLEEPVPPKQKLRSIARSTLHLSSLLTYTQGFELIAKASEEYNWNIDVSECARIWLGGCIIRSTLLAVFMQQYSNDRAEQKTAAKYMNDHFSGEKQVHFRLFLQATGSRGLPTPASSAALHYYDALRRERLPQNLTQAQRDFFGAHGYERRDTAGVFHTEWQHADS